MPLTTGESALGASVIAIAGTLAGAWVQARRDDRRWARERQQESERWRREDIQREAERQQAGRVRELELRHEDSVRWIDRRLSAHIRLIDASRTLQQVLFEIHIWRKIAEDNPSVVSPEDLRPNTDEAMAAINSATAELQLLTSDPVRGHVLEIRRIVRDADRAAVVAWILDGEAEKRAELREKLHEEIQKIQPALDKYVAAARRELGTVHGRLDAATGAEPPELT